MSSQAQNPDDDWWRVIVEVRDAARRRERHEALLESLRQVVGRDDVLTLSAARMVGRAILEQQNESESPAVDVTADEAGHSSSTELVAKKKKKNKRKKKKNKTKAAVSSEDASRGAGHGQDDGSKEGAAPLDARPVTVDSGERPSSDSIDELRTATTTSQGLPVVEAIEGHFTTRESGVSHRDDSENISKSLSVTAKRVQGEGKHASKRAKSMTEAELSEHLVQNQDREAALDRLKSEASPISLEAARERRVSLRRDRSASVRFLRERTLSRSSSVSGSRAVSPAQREQWSNKNSTVQEDDADLSASPTQACKGVGEDVSTVIDRAPQREEVPEPQTAISQGFTKPIVPRAPPPSTAHSNIDEVVLADSALSQSKLSGLGLTGSEFVERTDTYSGRASDEGVPALTSHGDHHNRGSSPTGGEWQAVRKSKHKKLETQDHRNEADANRQSRTTRSQRKTPEEKTQQRMDTKQKVIADQTARDSQEQKRRVVPEPSDHTAFPPLPATDAERIASSSPTSNKTATSERASSSDPKPKVVHQSMGSALESSSPITSQTTSEHTQEGTRELSEALEHKTAQPSTAANDAAGKSPVPSQTIPEQIQGDSRELSEAREQQKIPPSDAANDATGNSPDDTFDSKVDTASDDASRDTVNQTEPVEVEYHATDGQGDEASEPSRSNANEEQVEVEENADVDAASDRANDRLSTTEHVEAENHTTHGPPTTAAHDGETVTKHDSEQVPIKRVVAEAPQRTVVDDEATTRLHAPERFLDMIRDWNNGYQQTTDPTTGHQVVRRDLLPYSINNEAFVFRDRAFFVPPGLETEDNVTSGTCFTPIHIPLGDPYTGKVPEQILRDPLTPPHICRCETSSGKAAHIFYDPSNHRMVIHPMANPHPDHRNERLHPEHLPPHKLAEYQAYEQAGYAVHRFDRAAFECALASCRAPLLDHLHSTIMCQVCGPYSAIRYCSVEHLYADVDAHWRICGATPFRAVWDPDTLPGRYHLQAPGIRDLTGWNSAARQRQLAHSLHNHGRADYVVFHPSVFVIFAPTDPIKDVFNRLLNLAFFDRRHVVALAFVYRVLRRVFRRHGIWNPQLEQALAEQMFAEFAFHPGLLDQRDECLADWSPALAKKRAGKKSKGKEAKRGETMPGGLEGLCDAVEAQKWILRVWRREHPTEKLWVKRMVGVGFVGVPVEDMRDHVSGEGWSGWGYARDERVE